jgi:hypothetical protein
MARKYIKWPENMPNGQKIDPMSIKHSNIFNFKTLRIGLFYMKIYHVAKNLHVPNGQKIYQMAIKHSNNFNCPPNWTFWYENIPCSKKTVWQPCRVDKMPIRLECAAVIKMSRNVNYQIVCRRWKKDGPPLPKKPADRCNGLLKYVFSLKFLAKILAFLAQTAAIF